MSLSLDDVLEEEIQIVILTREGRGRMGGGGDNPGGAVRGGFGLAHQLLAGWP